MRRYLIRFLNYKVTLWLLILAYVTIFLSLNIARYNSLFSFEWEDEATENQLVWNTAHGKIFQQSIFGGFSFGHFNLFRVIVAFVYSFFPHIFTLYFLSSLALALSSLIIFKVSQKILKNDLTSFLISVTYLFYPPLHFINIGPYDTVIFSVPFVLLAFYYFINKDFKFFVLFLVLAITCLESLSFVAVMFSFYALICKRQKKWIVYPLLIGVAWLILTIYFVYPHISDIGYMDKSNIYGFYAIDSHTLSMIAKFIITSPVNAAKSMFSIDHIFLITRMIMPLLFLPLLSLATFLCLHGYMQILLLINRSLTYDQSYYLANIIPFLFVGYILGIRHLSKILNKFKLSPLYIERINISITVSSLTLCFLGMFGNNIYGSLNQDTIYDNRLLNVQNIYSPVFYKMDEADKIAWELINLIPKNASVSASGDLLIPLSHRERIVEFGPLKVDYPGGRINKLDYFDTDYILINRKNMYFGAGHYAQPRDKDWDILRSLINAKVFKVLADRGSYILLKREKIK